MSGMADEADAEGYALLDVRDGRRIERLGSRVVDRPAPGARDGEPLKTSTADLRFDHHTGWTGDATRWELRWHDLRLELRPTDAGQVGVFPEHALLWPALRGYLGRRPGATVLHLFAYTGATTLALARAGARVAHVDASRSAVAWARRNAELSGLADRPVRWIVDDVRTFVAREIRRGRRYDGVVLDPPSYGHGSGGRQWRLDTDLDPLLDAIATLTGPAPLFVALTAHSPAWPPTRLQDALARHFETGDRECGALELATDALDVLHLGAYALGAGSKP